MSVRSDETCVRPFCTDIGPSSGSFAAVYMPARIAAVFEFWKMKGNLPRTLCFEFELLV
jgi:hypothetical protein